MNNRAYRAAITAKQLPCSSLAAVDVVVDSVVDVVVDSVVDVVVDSVVDVVPADTSKYSVLMFHTNFQIKVTIFLLSKLPSIIKYFRRVSTINNILNVF